MIWMKATAVPFRIARSALAEFLLAQAPAYIVRSSMSTVRDAPDAVDLLRGEGAVGPAAFGVVALLRFRSARQHNGVAGLCRAARQARARRLGRSSDVAALTCQAWTDWRPLAEMPSELHLDLRTVRADNRQMRVLGVLRGLHAS